MYCNTMLEGEVYCNGYCIAGAVGCVLQYKDCIAGLAGENCVTIQFLVL